MNKIVIITVVFIGTFFSYQKPSSANVFQDINKVFNSVNNLIVNVKKTVDEIDRISCILLTSLDDYGKTDLTDSQDTQCVCKKKQ